MGAGGGPQRQELGGKSVWCVAKAPAAVVQPGGRAFVVWRLGGWAARSIYALSLGRNLAVNALGGRPDLSLGLALPDSGYQLRPKARPLFLSRLLRDLLGTLLLEGGAGCPERRCVGGGVLSGRPCQP